VHGIQGPEFSNHVRKDRRMIVKVNKAMYGLIQSAKLWYNELTTHLTANGFKVCKSDKWFFVKKMPDGRYVVVLLYVDDILVLSADATSRYAVKELLESKYEKVTVIEGDRLPYLGMAIVKASTGYEICMRVYIKDVLNFMGSLFMNT
jgi:hypothetical protein